MQKEIRWHGRFDNFSRALESLQTPLKSGAPLNDLEMSGIVRRFQRASDLAWKLLKDRLEHGGVELPATTPLAVIKAAFAAEFIKDGDAWLDMLKAGNNTSHNYDANVRQEITDNIRLRYAALLSGLHKTLGAEL